MSRPSKPRQADPVALRSPAMCRFFLGVMRRQMRSSFRAVRLARPGVPEIPADRPLVVYTNHPSWWDPAFFIVMIGRHFMDRDGYAPIDADMLRSYPFMRRIGLFGVARGERRGAAEFLRQAGTIVEDPARMLWVTAQGTFTDPRARPVTLKPGVARLMARHPDILAVPLAVEYPFWSEKRPEALALFGAPVTMAPDETPDELNARLGTALGDAMDGLAERAMARDPSAFERVLDGSAGVGGVYGMWGRLRAAATGRRYVADHLEET